MKLSQGRLNQIMSGDEPYPDELYELIKVYRIYFQIEKVVTDEIFNRTGNQISDN